MHNIRAILMVTLAMAAFSIEDGLIKALARDMPLGQVLFLLGTGGALIFATLARARGHRLTGPAARSPALLYRALAEAASVLTFTIALTLVDLSTVAAVFQATPLAITMGAALFLGEHVGWRRWTAIGLGFAGVLIIIRPGLDGFQPMAMIVLVSVLTIAARDLITRRLPGHVPSLVVGAQAFATVALSGLALLALGSGTVQMPGGLHLLMLAGAMICGTAGYYGIVQAMRLGEAAAIMPFRYTRLVFSIILGMIVFGERPDLPTFAGAVIILATGLYTFMREQKLARQAQRSSC